MVKLLRLVSFVLARFLLSAIFLASAIHKLLHWQETEKLLSTTLFDWQANVASLSPYFNMLLPWTPLLLIGATLLELIGSLLVLMGVHEKIGALCLIAFLIPTTLLLHPFWMHEVGDDLQMAMFLKNLAILGGLLLVALQGAQEKASPPKSPFFDG